MAAGDLFKGFLETDLRPDEMIVEVRLHGFEHASLKEMCRRQGDFAVVAAAVALRTADGRCNDARVVLGGVAGNVLRMSSAESVLVGEPLSDETFAAAAAAAAGDIDPPADLQGPPQYRRHLVGVLVRRALVEAAGDRSAWES